MEHYVTLFDIGFAPQGIALHRALQRHAGDHTLWVVCMDQAVEDLLRQLRLPDVRTVPIADVENEELREARKERTRSEYCWTLTPFTFDIVFDREPSAGRVTYVDADVWLLASPAPIFADFEASGAAVQITEHAYASEHDQTEIRGKYCVQFLTMQREQSVPVRRWWQERCIEWCFARSEDGKFGDQKYLDDWPERFATLVHVADPRGRFQGPWNATRFPYSEAITYHFHSLRLARAGFVRPVDRTYPVPDPHWRHVYTPYLEDLAHAVKQMAEVTGHAPEPQLARKALRSRIKPRKVLKRAVRRWRSLVSAARRRDLVKLPDSVSVPLGGRRIGP